MIMGDINNPKHPSNPGGVPWKPVVPYKRLIRRARVVAKILGFMSVVAFLVGGTEVATIVSRFVQDGNTGPFYAASLVSSTAVPLIVTLLSYAMLQLGSIVAEYIAARLESR